MLKAACCMGFFGFLWAAEFTTLSWQEYDKGSQLSLGDVAVDSHSNPSLLRVHIKQRISQKQKKKKKKKSRIDDIIRVITSAEIHALTKLRG